MNCKFQDGPCHWEWDNELLEDTFYWNRTNGEILSQNNLVGPSADQFEDTKGEYVLIINNFLFVFKF